MPVNLQSQIRLDVSIRLTSVNFTNELKNKSSAEYKDLKTHVVSVVFTNPNLSKEISGKCCFMQPYLMRRFAEDIVAIEIN